MATLESTDALGPFAFDELTSEPWRNGGGTTRTVASGGPGRNGWDWRVSVADIACDGPFSAFPGVERHLALMEGNGVVLCGDGSRMRLVRIGEVVSFAGDLPLDARLIDGPVRVWNLMVVRATSAGWLHEHDGSPMRLVHPDGLVRFLTVVAGSYRLRGPGIAETRVTRGKVVRLDAPMEDIQLRAVDDRAIALISDIRPLRLPAG